MLLADWNRDVAEICYHGLRMSAEEFFSLAARGRTPCA